MLGNFNHKNKFAIASENYCLRLLVLAFQVARSSNSIQLDWNENDITYVLNDYIKKNPLTNEWNIVTNREDSLSDESIPRKKGFANRSSRIDLRFVRITSPDEYTYYAEAKNLKENDSALKRRYIDTGINSFVGGKYKNGCLLAYILEGDLMKCIEGVNKLLKKDKREVESLIKHNFPYFDHYFESKHPKLGILKHLAFDFT
jgi:hypothetical protein